MRIAEVVSVKKHRLEIPEAFARTLGLHDRSTVSVCRTTSVPYHTILTTIPVECWKRVLHVSVLLHNRAGALDAIIQVLSTLNIHILVMEGYGKDTEGRWSGVVELPENFGGGEPATYESACYKIVNRFHTAFTQETTTSPENQPTPWPFPEEFDPRESKGSLKCESNCLQWLGSVEDTPPVNLLSVDRMALTTLAVKHDQQEVFEYDHRSRTVPIEDSRTFPIENTRRQRRGLLLCNTEQRFLRFVEIPALVEVELHLKAESSDIKQIGHGALRSLTEAIRETETGSSPSGINIIFLFNYITGRSSKKGKPLGASEEKSVVKLFLEPPPNWGKANWISWFHELALTKFENPPSSGHREPIVDKAEADRCRLHIWREPRWSWPGLRGLNRISLRLNEKLEVVSNYEKIRRVIDKARVSDALLALGAGMLTWTAWDHFQNGETRTSLAIIGSTILTLWPSIRSRLAPD